MLPLVILPVSTRSATPLVTAPKPSKRESWAISSTAGPVTRSCTAPSSLLGSVNCTVSQPGTAAGGGGLLVPGSVEGPVAELAPQAARRSRRSGAKRELRLLFAAILRESLNVYVIGSPVSFSGLSGDNTQCRHRTYPPITGAVRLAGGWAGLALAVGSLALRRRVPPAVLCAAIVGLRCQSCATGGPRPMPFSHQPLTLCFTTYYAIGTLSGCTSIEQ